MNPRGLTKTDLAGGGLHADAASRRELSIVINHNIVTDNAASPHSGTGSNLRPARNDGALDHGVLPNHNTVP